MYIIHIYEPIDIFVLFSVDHDTEYGWLEKKMGQLDLYTPKYEYQRLYVTRIQILYDTGEKLVICHIYGTRAIFVLFCVHQLTEHD